MEFEELYQEIILDHYRTPRNRCSDEEATEGDCVKHENPLCGDELLLRLEMNGDGETIGRVCFAGHGCSISQASASMMTEAVTGLSREKALAMVDRVRAMMHGEEPDEDLGDAEALQGVSKFPVRIKCALLGWLALKESLENGKHETGKKHEHN